MKLEHLALNVAEPKAMAAWYVEHLGLRVAWKLETPPYTHFLADTGGAMAIEVYHNPPDRVPPYAEMDPLLLHVAFVSEDPKSDGEALLAAGAALVDEVHLDDGSHLVMLRDPWGLAIQLCKRAVSILDLPKRA
ncbi:MAG: VOC family protein [Planctomycetota bacterium]|jgi:catechol 2,3-dioxygenase-like lactoylglutathione lyase family enzyme